MAPVVAVVVVGAVLACLRCVWPAWRRVGTVTAAAAAMLVPVIVPAPSLAAAAPSDPVVLMAKATPSSLPSTGGEATVLGKVRGSAVCSVAVLGDHGIKVSRPAPVPCSGAYREKLGFGPNSSPSPVVVKLGLMAGNARGVFYVVVAGAPSHPQILAVRAYPWRLPDTGGWTTIVGHVRNAKTCHLVALDWAHPDLASQGCASGTFTEKLWLSPNDKHVAVSEAFELVATGQGKPAVGKFFVGLAAAPLPPPTTTTTLPPATTPPVTTTTVPPAPPYIPPPPPYVPPETTTTVPITTTTVAPTTTTTVPPTTTTTVPTTTTTVPPTTTTTTVPTTTTTVPPTTTTTVAPPPLTTTTTTPATTTTVPATTTTSSTTTTVPSTTTTTVPPSPSLVEEFSPNWSGYAVQGSQSDPLAATEVTGTFTVPQLTYAASCNDVMSAWDGIDGLGGTAGANYLIQAGVTLMTVAPYGPDAGTCAPSGQFYIVPWWEVITPTNVAPATDIETWDDGSQAVVEVGDQVTVTIWEVSPGEWNILLTDYNPSTGVTETFNYYDYYGSDVSYTGPGASAEWVVEDTDQPNNPNCTWPGNGVYLCPMPAYDPSVSFTGSGFNNSGLYDQTDQIFMVDQAGNVVSQPSSISANGDFDVSYVGNGTNAPEGAVRVTTLGSGMPSTVKSFPPGLSPQPHRAPR
jgi:hypothetical protein